MKCSSRRNCDLVYWAAHQMGSSLNEVQFPKELRPGPPSLAGSRCGLNEVQFPRELRPELPATHAPHP